MKIAIVEDEKIYMEDLQNTLFGWKPDNMELEVASFYTGEEIVKRYCSECSEYDLIFMDIKLDGIDGLEAARQLREAGYEGAIAFLTSHTDFKYVQDGYNVSALHYFEKPIKKENIEACINLLATNNHFKHLYFKYLYNGKEIFISCKEILYFESQRNYIVIHTLNSKLSPYKYKGNISSVLSQVPKSFVQCHRSYVVNMTHVVLIKNKDLFMRSQEQIPIPIGDKYLGTVLSSFTDL